METNVISERLFRSYLYFFNIAIAAMLSTLLQIRNE